MHGKIRGNKDFEMSFAVLCFFVCVCASGLPLYEGLKARLESFRS